MLLVAMVLGVLLIRKIPERWFCCLFLTCILMNVIYLMCRKTPCFSYVDIRHFHRIYASN